MSDLLSWKIRMSRPIFPCFWGLLTVSSCGCREKRNQNRHTETFKNRCNFTWVKNIINCSRKSRNQRTFLHTSYHCANRVVCLRVSLLGNTKGLFTLNESKGEGNITDISTAHLHIKSAKTLSSNFHCPSKGFDIDVRWYLNDFNSHKQVSFSYPETLGWLCVMAYKCIFSSSHYSVHYIVQSIRCLLNTKISVRHRAGKLVRCIHTR